MHSILRAGLLLGLWATPVRPSAGTRVATAAADCPATGHLITTPTLYQDSRWVESSLRAVAAAGPGDVWAVGDYSAYIGKSRQERFAALIEHWTGNTWKQMPSPEVGSGLSANLRALVAIRPNDIWAVGGAVSNSNTQPLVEHWDGSAWRIMPPPPGDGGLSLSRIAASGPFDVWTAGEGAVSGQAFHWDGRAWQDTAVPQPAGVYVTWAGLVAFAPGDAWIAGRIYNPRLGHGTGSLVAHWDGQTWTLQTPPMLPPYAQLRGFAAAGPRDIWAAGAVEPPPGPIPTEVPSLTPGAVSTPSVPAGPVILRWDGSRWARVPIPNDPVIEAMLFSRPDDGWATGYLNVPGQQFGLLHWDGSRWTPVDIARYQEMRPMALLARAAETPDDLWAVGVSTTYAPPQYSTQSAVHIFRDCAVPTAPTADPHDSAVTYFPVTGHTLRGLFRDYWTSHGGLARFGYPRTDEFPEKNATNGRIYTVQYFERNRFELHPENAGTPYAVLLGRAIAAGHESDSGFQPRRSGPPGARFFPATGHSLASAFRPYWEQHGALPVYGYPISEPFQEFNRAGDKTYLVQYFERNRLELHPELPAEYRVSLGLLGVDLLRSRGWLR